MKFGIPNLVLILTYWISFFPVMIFAVQENQSRQEAGGEAAQRAVLLSCNELLSPLSSPPAGDSGDLGFSSDNVDLLARLSLDELAPRNPAVRGSGIWGWTDANGNQYALVALSNATVFVDITVPQRPFVIGRLPTAQGNSSWREVQVYRNRAYIVAAGSENAKHGIQVFDLKQLRQPSPTSIFKHNHLFSEIGQARGIAINQRSGFGYVYGSPSLDSKGGLIALDLNTDSFEPQVVGIFSDVGEVHSVQVVTYHGPDRLRWGREFAICLCGAALVTIDVTDKRNMKVISRVELPESAFAHHGWLSEDHSYLFMCDKLDERRSEQNHADQYPPDPTAGVTRTHVWSMKSLAEPTYLGQIEGNRRGVDHRVFVSGEFIFQANFTGGLSVLDGSEAQLLRHVELGHFDTYPQSDDLSFNGAWSVFPFFSSGVIVVSDRQNGLFILRFSPL